MNEKRAGVYPRIFDSGSEAKSLRSSSQTPRNVTGAERANQHRFAAELALAFGFSGRQTQLESLPTCLAGRPFVAETSLNTRAVRRALETPLPMLREGLSRFAEQADAFQLSLNGAGRLRHAAQAA